MLPISPLMKTRTLAILTVALIIVVSGCSTANRSTVGPTNSTAGPASPMTRTSEGGQVTVVVDWAGPGAEALFEVKLDTHSVDLDALDLSNAVLRNDRGESLSPQPWTAPKGGHHREGALSFPDAAPFLAGARWIELVLPGVGDMPERTLRWELSA